MSPDALTQERLGSAEAAFLDYDYGSAIAASANGWEWSSPGDEMSRIVFLEPLITGESTERTSFTVRFHPNSTEIAEAYALDAHGSFLGEAAIPAAPQRRPAP